MPWLRKTQPAESLAVSMSGVKLGDRLLVLGGSDPKLIASLALKVGLTGRACAVDVDPRRAEEASHAVEREGALVETFSTPYTALPFDPDSFDLVVTRDVLPSMTSEDRGRALQEAWRVLRAGGRCLVIDTTGRGTFGALFGRQTTGEGLDVPRTLEAGRFVAVRTLAAREGLVFVEGVKRNA
jgi:ubiquinone/menaquinone biosynthesis C-methylase UbiE